MPSERTIAVVGLGYVGLPLALAFGRTKYKTFGFDIDKERIGELKGSYDRLQEVPESDLKDSQLIYTSDEADLQEANFIAIAVPTPVTKDNRPDLGPLEKASTLVGRNLRPGSIVVYESTVYPGVTEDICVPILAETSGLVFGKDFTVGYSPERINPGDAKHGLAQVVKIVSGSDPATADSVASIYGAICPAGVHPTQSIKVAEAAKIIENTQRDINIALVNELSQIFHLMGIDTQAVLEAAGTKWNFHHYKPGLVGGHCISVDPYYLIHQANSLGYEPTLIRASRNINDRMDEFVVAAAIESLKSAGKEPRNARVLVMGLTFKADVKDTRNSRISLVLKQLSQLGCALFGYDPLLEPVEIEKEFAALAVTSLNEEYDAIIIAAPHKQFKELEEKIIAYAKKGTAIVDLTGLYRQNLASGQYNYWTL